ncbi:MAG: HD domain-containing protein [Bacilli bacterium]|nr:HD domain-containing protein [Bacilli bacterium]
MYLDVINDNMKKKNSLISEYACKDEDAIRLFDEEDNDIRTAYFRDIDRILYSLSYTRYMDKTQVFSFNDNDNISKRMTHVQMVSKIARTIGRALNLNEDLIEAAALGHDLGHVPFGHVGERILNEISLKNNCGYFNHNVQSVRTLMDLEDNGKGKNISFQVLDAILCHNGELELDEYRSSKKDKNIFLDEYNRCYTDKDMIKKLVPCTLEGCVVRISDIIAYIGRDIEDAMRMNLITIDQIPSSVTSVLGTSNREIINTIIMDILENSYDKDYIKVSDKVFKAIKDLKEFNYEYIYKKANSDEQIDLYNKMFNTIFDTYLNDVKNDNKNSRIFTIFLNDMDSKYLDNNSAERKVIDYIAGMTDDYMESEYERIIGG